jgi:hypothetical protein
MANSKEAEGWKKLLSGYPWFSGEGNFPIQAYSEFMPPPRLGCSPNGEIDHSLFEDDDLWGWQIKETEEEFELKPGLEHIMHQIMGNIIKLGKGIASNHIAGHGGQNLSDNPYWPPELSGKAGSLDHEKYVTILPLMLSRTQDDKGRVRWTFFGGSIHGPEKAFWKSFYTNANQELPEKDSIAVVLNILSEAYGIHLKDQKQLHGHGFRILPADKDVILPGWTRPFIIDKATHAGDIKYLLTFMPFAQLPSQIKENYLSGKLALIPFPGSLVFWEMPTYKHLLKQMALAMQIPLLKLVARHTGHGGIRVPQSCWLHEPHPDIKASDFHEELVNNHYHRTHRWQRIHRHENELSMAPNLAKVAKVLFSTDLETLGLYDKPMARNCQVWTKNFDLLIDGPNAKKSEIFKAETTLFQGGLFGYRFFFPPMRVGLHQIYWHRPQLAFLNTGTNETVIKTEALSGYVTAYHVEDRNYENPVELWPRILKRPVYMQAIHNINYKHDHYAHQTTLNIINLLEHKHVLGEKPLPRKFALHLLRIKKHESFEQWMTDFDVKVEDSKVREQIRSEINKVIEPAGKENGLPKAITFQETATRSFEENWWNEINFLAHGKFINKDNADCVQDEVTLQQVSHHHRDLERLGDYLIERNKKMITDAGMTGKAFCGELPFKWHTDFDFNVFGGWKRNQEGHTYERNILTIIPGKNRKEAVVMADHYDTAYMEDIFNKSQGGSGARISAAGADDNYSATSTLLNAAPIFLKLSNEGKLERDIWLLNLTGEEFPSDCLGARHFCQSVIEKALKMKLENGEFMDLSDVRVTGVFVMDMIGHNRDNDKDIFQISPGKTMSSVRLAYQAHLANELWNANTHIWNRSPERIGCKRGERIKEGGTIPEIAHHLHLWGEIRTQFDPHSSLFNTDGQIFSDAGVPVVLFMENYDISRTGYHDTKDTMENIDLDFGAALAAIAIETVARVATLKEI